MRRTSRVRSGVAAGVLCLVALTGATGCGAGTPSPEPSAVRATSSPYPQPSLTPAPGYLSLNASNSVTRVIDGDTFELDGRRVRVLGIDSCELATPAGARAKLDAEGLLLGRAVTLQPEPGVDTDRNGRLLRYVSVAGADFGEQMVTDDHTAVYEGENDASPAYVSRLEGADTDGRTCEDPVPVTTTTQPPVDDEVDVPDVDAPNPDVPNVDRPRRTSSGGSGGGGRVGRDGDGDGLCNESTVPVPC